MLERKVIMKYINKDEFNKEVEGDKVLVDFFATWCGPCKMLGLVLEKFDEEKVIPILKLDVDEVKEVAEAMSNYAAAEKSVILKRVKLISIIGLISLVIGLVMEAINYDSMIPIYECMKETCLGFGVGALATMVLYTTGILEKIKNRKSKQMKIVAIFCSGIIAICIIVSLILTII